jgi:hypothetical protein
MKPATLVITSVHAVVARAEDAAAAGFRDGSVLPVGGAASGRCEVVEVIVWFPSRSARARWTRHPAHSLVIHY